MIGKLRKKNDYWVLRYSLIDGESEISLHPDDEIFLMGVKEWNDDDIHFKIVPFIHDTFVAKIIDEDDSPEPNEALKLAKKKFDASVFISPYVSDDFQIGPDGAYENIRPYSTPYEDAERIISYFKNYRFHISQMDIVIMSTKVVDEIIMALENAYNSKEIIDHYKSVKEHINDYK